MQALKPARTRRAYSLGPEFLLPWTAGVQSGLYGPDRMISLSDMIKFFIHEFTMQWSRVENAARQFELAAAGEKGQRLLQPQDFVSLVPVTSGLRFICKHLGLQYASQQADQFEHILESKPCSYQTVDALLEKLISAIKREADEKMLALIPSDKLNFFEQDALFGKAVNRRFPSAVLELRDAGNCLAADLNTAAVFHLMRVLELGLHLHVRVKKKPIEYAEWGSIIKKIDENIEAKIPKARGPKQTEALDFYRGLMGEFNAFKDVWRNNVMHTRRSYNAAEAIGVHQRVREFMQRLAARVSE
jgi:hypothetical protein